MTGNRASLVIVVILLLAANAALAWQIHRWLTPGPAEPMVAEVAAETTALPPLDPIASFEMPQEDRYAAIVQRPLFSPSRLPVPGIAAPLGAQSSDLHVILTGIVYSATERLVLLRPEGFGGILLLEEGQRYDGWTLDEIRPEQAVFRSGTREVVLEMVFDNELGPASQNNEAEDAKE